MNQVGSKWQQYIDSTFSGQSMWCDMNNPCDNSKSSGSVACHVVDTSTWPPIPECCHNVINIPTPE